MTQGGFEGVREEELKYTEFWSYILCHKHIHVSKQVRKKFNYFGLKTGHANMSRH